MFRSFAAIITSLCFAITLRVYRQGSRETCRVHYDYYFRMCGEYQKECGLERPRTLEVPGEVASEDIEDVPRALVVGHNFRSIPAATCKFVEIVTWIDIPKKQFISPVREVRPKKNHLTRYVIVHIRLINVWLSTALRRMISALYTVRASDRCTIPAIKWILSLLKTWRPLNSAHYDVKMFNVFRLVIQI